MQTPVDEKLVALFRKDYLALADKAREDGQTIARNIRTTLVASWIKQLQTDKVMRMATVADLTRWPLVARVENVKESSLLATKSKAVPITTFVFSVGRLAGLDIQLPRNDRHLSRVQCIGAVMVDMTAKVNPLRIYVLDLWSVDGTRMLHNRTIASVPGARNVILVSPDQDPTLLLGNNVTLTFQIRTAK